MNTASVPITPNYEAMYKSLHEEMAHMKVKLTEESNSKIQKLECEKRSLEKANESLQNQLTKSQSERAELFSKVEIYEFCIRAFTGMGEKGKGCGCKE